MELVTWFASTLHHRRFHSPASTALSHLSTSLSARLPVTSHGQVNYKWSWIAITSKSSSSWILTFRSYISFFSHYISICGTWDSLVFPICSSEQSQRREHVYIYIQTSRNCYLYSSDSELITLKLIFRLFQMMAVTLWLMLIMEWVEQSSIPNKQL